MYTFATRYKAKLLNLGLYEYVVLFKIYVDDHNQAGWCLPYGTLYTSGKLYIPGKGWRGRPNTVIDDQTKLDIEERADNLLTLLT